MISQRKRGQRAVFLLKALFVILAVAFTLPLGGCSEDPILEESRVYNINDDIRSLKIDIIAADLTVEKADRFYVETNLRYLSVSINGDTLILKDKKDTPVTFKGGILKVGIPADGFFEFDSLSISTGAANLMADSLSAKALELKLGAGNVTIGSLSASESAKIDGGAGKFTVHDGVIKNLTLNMGVGDLSMTAALLGKNEMNFSIGRSELNLAGSREDYSIEIEKGIGTVRVDGIEVTDFGTSAGNLGSVKLKGGIGEINISFTE